MLWCPVDGTTICSVFQNFDAAFLRRRVALFPGWLVPSFSQRLPNASVDAHKFLFSKSVFHRKREAAQITEHFGLVLSKISSETDN